jgi:two-component system sensor histidine kinase RpfC
MAGAGEILLRHIEALLNASRDEIGRDAPHPKPVDLFALLLSLRGLLAVEAEKKGLRLGLSIDATTPRHVLAEPGLLLDILQNLGGNAVKFTPFGAVSIHVGAVRRAEGDVLLRFEVRDTGVGVDKAAQERIFETFVQAGPDIAPRFGGSGLGLAIARRRLSARGGRIGVESDIGKGALFWFELSAERAEAAPQALEFGSVAPALRLDALDGAREQRTEPACVIASAPFDTLELAWEFAFCVVARLENEDEIAMAQRKTGWLKALLRGAPAADGEGHAPRLDGRRLLLAEDNGVNRKILTAILAGGGCDVTAVEDGHAALEAMLMGTFDLVLLDLNLPKIAGLDVARLYRFGRPGAGRAPVVALTADASPERRDECLEAGMARCLTKPIAPDALLAAVADVLNADDAAGAKQREEAQAKQREETPAKTPQAVRDAVLSSSALDALARLGGESFLREVIEQFMAEGGETAERMTRAVECGDLAAFRHEAHAFESSAGNVGAVALAALCRSWRGVTPEAFALYGDDYLDDLRGVWAEAGAALAGALARRAAGGDRRGRGVAA